MARRYRGFPYPEGLLVLDEVTGEVRLVRPDGARRSLNAPTLVGVNHDSAENLVKRAALEIETGINPHETLLRALSVGRAEGNEDAVLDATWLSASLALDCGDRRAAERLSAELALAEGPRRVAQVAALDVRTAILEGDLPRARELFAIVDSAFRDATPVPEVHELPLDAAVAIARADEPSRVLAMTAALSWLRGRSHRLTEEIAALADAA